ncbi:hypothetical protein [Thiosocius teredinicola]|uniref:hypothetical protein n=1 Tax=Thiosocius teredinicola TaxID=1973002 RepID=UPI000F7786EC
MKTLVVLALLSSMSAGAMAAQAQDQGEGYGASSWNQAVAAEAQKLRSHPVHRSSYWNNPVLAGDMAVGSPSPLGPVEAPAARGDRL